ncbi:MAG: hypothetical protein KIS72_06130 [Luteimonas sp.]|nr:hypothetical protein [Luteimonas sp.]
MKIQAALLLASTLLCASAANAADAQICYSGNVSTTAGGGFGTIVYPQVTNSTLFTCRSGVQFTIGQLAGRGWKIVSLAPVVYSVQTSEAGATTVQRFQLIINN